MDAFRASAGAPADQRTVRRANLATVLASLREGGPRSRARLAGDLALNKATVSSLVTELIERGLVREGRAERGLVGRPGTTIELDGRTVAGVSAEINVNHVSTYATDLRGEVLSDRRASVDAAGQEPRVVLAALAQLLALTLADLEAADARPVGLVVGVAGLVDRERGVLTVAPNLGWREVPVADVLRELLLEAGAPAADLPVEVHNEANLAVVAEIKPGDPARRDMVFVHGEVGIGGGIVTRGRLLDGQRGYAGEVGHMVVDAGGRRCGCGRRGCWETTIGFSRLVELAAAGEHDALASPALGLDNRIAEIDRRAGAGDERTLAALDEVARWVARGAATLVDVLNPSTIVLGGYLGLLGHRMIDVLTAELADSVVAPEAGGTRIELSTLGFGATAQGGARIALERVFDNPTLVERRLDAADPRVSGAVS